jgi:hypothetical protein
VAEKSALGDCYTPSASSEGSVVIVSLEFVALVNFTGLKGC